MNEPLTPTPHLENSAPQDQSAPVAPNAAISQSVNPASEQTPTQPAGQPQAPATAPLQEAKSVLIIEDERFISELYTRALEKAGYTVTSAGDGEEALKIATTQHFDLILLDIMLPTMNGVDLLYKMKDPQSQNPVNSKVIITTNMDQKEETKAKVEQMADGYLIKAEVTPKELVSYVGQVFGS